MYRCAYTHEAVISILYIVQSSGLLLFQSTTARQHCYYYNSIITRYYCSSSYGNNNSRKKGGRVLREKSKKKPRNYPVYKKYIECYVLLSRLYYTIRSIYTVSTLYSYVWPADFWPGTCYICFTPLSRIDYYYYQKWEKVPSMAIVDNNRILVLLVLICRALRCIICTVGCVCMYLLVCVY